MEGGFEGFDEAVKIVSDGGPMPAGDAAFGENSSHGWSVGVSDLTEEKFGSDGDDFCDHGGVSLQRGVVLCGEFSFLMKACLQSRSFVGLGYER